MATQFSIDDAFVLEGDEEGAVSDGEPQGWKDREGGEMTFGPLTFSKPQTHPSPAAAGSLEHSNLKYQNLENEDAFGSNGNSSFNNFFKISDPANLSYCSSQWSFSTLSSVTQLSAHCCGWVSHPLVKKNRKVVLASFLLLITGVALIFTGVVIQLNPNAGVSSAIFFVPGFLLFIPGVYHVIYISCAVRGRRGFKLFYLPYFEK
ncbi:transmembrane protein 134 [Notolabrus celidotus]|uniref:transmembrane protein 134 n=1 Tax=Notolabrus celidotus TaxID=1203425 RepID=UPI0014904D18|nr:transmembrane protein 134 [Notolabrus celidotus]XP_034544720.1 transmembrane protein 134 [Notolabrus celidotus]